LTIGFGKIDVQLKPAILVILISTISLSRPEELALHHHQHQSLLLVITVDLLGMVNVMEFVTADGAGHQMILFNGHHLTLIADVKFDINYTLKEKSFNFYK